MLKKMLLSIIVCFIVTSIKTYSQSDAVQKIETDQIYQEVVKIPSGEIPTLNKQPIIDGTPGRVSALTVETFEDPTFPPTGWTRGLVVGLTNYWVRSTETSGYGLSNGCVKYNFFSSSNLNAEYLQTPTFSPTVAGEVLQFDLGWSSYVSTTRDTIIIQTSTDGTIFTTLRVDHNDSNYTTWPVDNLITGPKVSATVNIQDSYWATKRIALPVGTVAIRFHAISNFGVSYWMDNIQTLVPPTPAAAMTGTYTINPGLPPSAINYQTFTAAATDLYTRGISGTVLLNVSAGNYAERFYIRPIPGTSSTRTVTFKNLGGVVNLNVSNANPTTTVTTDYGIALIGCDWVTLDGINITDVGTAALSRINRGIVIGSYAGQDGARNVTIKNCNITLGGSGVTESLSTGIVGTGNVQGMPSGTIDSILINSCKVDQSDRGFGTFATLGALNYPYPAYTNWTISGNTLGSTISLGSPAGGPIGIILSGCINSTISGNSIDSMKLTTVTTTVSLTGISMQISAGTVIDNRIKNMIHPNLTSATPLISGIQAGPFPGMPTYIINNTVTGLQRGFTSAASAVICVYGIYTTNFVSGIALTSPVYVLNNSVYLSNAGTPGFTSSCYRNFGSNLPVHVYNNLFYNSISTSGAAAISYAVFDATTTRNSILSNNNNLVSTGTNGAIGRYNNLTNALTLTEWKTGGGALVDTNSVSGAPVFSSAITLAVDSTNASNWVLNGRGNARTEVNHDIRGLARSIVRTTGATDIGAYEFGMTVAPPNAVESAPPTLSGTSVYTAFGDTAAVITYGSGGTVPTSLTVKEYTGTNPPGSGSVPTAKYSNMWWDMTATGGTGFTYTAKLYYDYAHQYNVENETFFTMARSTNLGSSWIHYGDATVDTMYNTVSKTGLTAFSFFTLDHSNSPLPVELTSFTASVNNGLVDLKWITKSENNNQGFAVERKSGNGQYEEITFVKGKGTTLAQQNYSFTDKPGTGNFTYRLKQVDFNGTSTYSKEVETEIVVPIVYSLSQNYPNPFNPNTMIKFSIPNNGMVKLSVYNAIGEKVATLVNQQMDAGNYDVNFNAAGYSSGIYFYKLESGSFTSIKKMIMLK